MFRVWVEGLGFRVQGIGVQGLGFRVQDIGLHMPYTLDRSKYVCHIRSTAVSVCAIHARPQEAYVPCTLYRGKNMWHIRSTAVSMTCGGNAVRIWHIQAYILNPTPSIAVWHT